MGIVWKDLFKPRWAIVVEVIWVPHLKFDQATGDVIIEPRQCAAVVRVPYKRPLDVPFNVFYNELSKTGNVIAAHRFVLRMLYGIGSTNRHNMSRPTIFKPSTAPAVGAFG